MLRGLMVLAGALATFWMATPAAAGEADVIAVSVTALATTGDQVRYRFDVTVQHADTGWDHYADAWEVVGPDGAVLATRTLFHPHVEEQPFTRSLTAELPAGLEAVTVRAHDSVHGLGGAEMRVTLPRE